MVTFTWVIDLFIVFKNCSPDSLFWLDLWFKTCTVTYYAHILVPLSKLFNKQQFSTFSICLSLLELSSWLLWHATQGRLRHWLGNYISSSKVPISLLILLCLIFLFLKYKSQNQQMLNIWNFLGNDFFVKFISFLKIVALCLHFQKETFWNLEGDTLSKLNI